mmetsp:Transcript_13603/g.29575  ORF Transcript_13603/g.29575 Transcript_13603/m.29575 type:complete len:217 (-) Transcript_13603:1143-1793(-)
MAVQVAKLMSHVFMLQNQTSGKSSAEMRGGSRLHFSHFSHWTHSCLGASFFPPFSVGVFPLSSLRGRPRLPLGLKGGLGESSVFVVSSTSSSVAFLPLASDSTDTALSSEPALEGNSVSWSLPFFGEADLPLLPLVFISPPISASIPISPATTAWICCCSNCNCFFNANFFARFFSFATSLGVCSSASQLLRFGSYTFSSQNQCSGRLSKSTVPGR